jgi:hypothetical protein
VIERAFERARAGSFADLGGVWAVDGGYSLHAMQRPGVARGCLVDDEITDATRRRARRFGELTLIAGNFADPAIRDRVGPVDVVLLFDVLLHQVAPDWDEVLEMYAPLTRGFAVVNPSWVGGEETVRLLDLGREEYLASVPPQDNHERVFDRMWEMDPAHGRIHRDVHEIWQWGIVDDSLRAKMEDLGFRLVYYENEGSWRGLDRFENHAFVFLRE